MALRHHLTAEVIGFLNSLPLTNDIFSWIEEFRHALQQLIQDVDRISIHVDVNHGLYVSSTTPLATLTKRHRAQERLPAVALPKRGPDHSTVTKQLLKDFRRKGHPVDDYQEPVSFDFINIYGYHFGSLILWRLKQNEPISWETIETILKLDRFMTFALSDAVARFNSTHLNPMMLLRALADIQESADLTELEVGILEKMLNGRSYKQVAGELDISLDTVRKWVKSMYRKTEVHSFTELFAKYFLP